MQEQELEATATTYTALVSAYCKSDDLDAALEVCLVLLLWQDAILHLHSAHGIAFYPLSSFSNEKRHKSSSTLQDFDALDACQISSMPMALHCSYPLRLPCPFCLSHSVMHCSIFRPQPDEW